jgi:hypothetical protein
MFFNKRRSAPVDQIPNTTEAKDELSTLAEEARSLLSKFADEPFKSMFQPSFHEIGEHEGVGVLLVASQLDQLDDDGMKVLHADNLVENILGFLSTTLVVTSLCLTISVTFMVQGILAFDPTAPSLGGEEWYAKWLDKDLMYALHWCESVLLATSIYNAIKGIFLAFGFYCGVSLYMPDMLAKCRFLMASITQLPDVWMYTITSIIFMMLALPFIGARASPVAALCSFIPLLGVVTIMKRMITMGDWMAAEQHRQAVKLLQAHERGKVS